MYVSNFNFKVFQDAPPSFHFWSVSRMDPAQPQIKGILNKDFELGYILLAAVQPRITS